MNGITQQAIEAVQKGINAFCKFISANDAGKTGGHQEGFYMPKSTLPMMFDAPGIKGANKDRFIDIKWQNDFTTESRFIYYGTGTRNEYRLTRFGKGFPFLTEDNVGDLFILVHVGGDYYEGYVLNTDEDIEDFFSAFNLSSEKTNNLIDKQNRVIVEKEDTPENRLLKCFTSYVSTVKVDFPETRELANQARNCFFYAYNRTIKNIKSEPDKEILNWLDAEFKLFKVFENDRYGDRIKTPFNSVEELVEAANTILNRRKSRAGKSLEHHLSEVFKAFDLTFDEQAVTENNKKPDFLFPGASAYHNDLFDKDKLIVLACKTTCKDRWRQVLNEADRVSIHHLFTLQQGISSNQLREMYDYGVRLVVPQPYIKTFPEEFRPQISSLENFVQHVTIIQTA